jgi:hypothetical protein
MNDVTKHEPIGLPADFGDSLMKGIEETRATLHVGGGKPFLRLLRNGTWVYGQNNDLVETGSRWAINLASLSRGWVCWDDGELLGQIMASVQVERLAKPAPVNDVEFKEQFGFELTCIDGEDAGVEVIYRNNSYGFVTAFDDLMAKIRDRYLKNKVYYWPVVTFGQESYDHKKFGETWNPILTIVAWANEAGEFPPEPAAAPAPKAAPPRREPLKAVQTPVAPAEPTSTVQAHVGQRRRPAPR